MPESLPTSRAVPQPIATSARARRALLAIFAHPDDESFRPGGTLALLAQRGVAVHLLTATRGEAGSRGDPPLCRPEQLGGVREAELRCACAALGIEPPRLLDYRDGTLSDVEDEEGAHHVLAAVQEIRPQVLITWPPDGLSGHADHVAVSRWAALAFERADSPAPLALYYLAVPRSLAQVLGLSHLHTVSDEEVSLSVDVAAVWEHKLAAIHCHRSQVNSSPILSAPEEKQRLFLGTEHFRLAADRPSRMRKNVLQSLGGVHP